MTISGNIQDGDTAQSSYSRNPLELFVHLSNLSLPAVGLVQDRVNRDIPKK